MTHYINQRRAARGEKPVNHKRVQRIMQENKLSSHAYERQTAKYKSYKGTTGRLHKNWLNRRFQTDRPTQKIGTDVAEFRWGTETINERTFGTFFIDFYSGEIISHALSLHPNTDFVLASLEEVQRRSQQVPHLVTIHSDQGTQYQSTAYQMALKQAHIRQSMSRKATPIDNGVVESIIHQIKVGTVLNHEYATRDALELAINQWIDSYNTKRIRQRNNWLTPVEMRLLYETNKAA